LSRYRESYSQARSAHPFRGPSSLSLKSVRLLLLPALALVPSFFQHRDYFSSIFFPSNAFEAFTFLYSFLLPFHHSFSSAPGSSLMLYEVVPRLFSPWGVFFGAPSPFLSTVLRLSFRVSCGPYPRCVPLLYAPLSVVSSLTSPSATF